MPSPATHLRAPLLWLLVPLMAGFTAARFWPPPEGLGLLPLAWIATVASLAATWFGGRTGWFAALNWALGTIVAATLAGFVMLHVREPHLHDLANRPPREITVSFRVRQVFPAAPQARTFTGLGEILASGENERELAGCRIYFSAIRKISVPPQRSGHYLMRGVIEPLPPAGPAAGFNDYLDNLGIRLKFTRGQIIREEESPGWFQQFCTRTETRLEKILHLGLQNHPAEDSLYVGMVLGAKAVLSADQQNAFMRSGTFHIFSISGLHVGVIAGALKLLFQLLRLPHRPATILTLLILWLYVQVTGGSSPAVRSLLMIAFLMGMHAFRLPGNRLAALVASALATLLLDPLQLFSTGFQMSYSVVIALVVMGVPLTEKWRAAWRPFALLPKPDWRWHHHRIDHDGRWLIAGCAGSWVAFLASAASGIGYFQLFSPGSLVANLVIIPLSTFAIYSGFLSLLCGLVGLSFLSVIFNWFAALLIRLMDWLVQHGTDLPATYFPAHFAQTWMAPASIIAMTAVMLAGVAGHWSRRYGGYWPPVVLLGLILIFGVKFS
jgi:competence protein ComEC